MALIDMNWKPDSRQLRQFGWVGAVVFTLLGLWAFFKHAIFGIHLEPSNAAILAWVLWATAAAFVALALARPALLKYPFIGLTLISLPIGLVVSHVLLAIVFFLVITPIGLLMRAFGKDILQRKILPGASTYWMAKEPQKDLRRYYRQF